ncbi:hypothetical protein [Carboxylicivirga sp. RSCT41]|uniref:hypothetical protein n=1 Tax=Carboxylicivirga agarovorans TaxID=3417570 RepID=UPI003D33CEDA
MVSKSAFIKEFKEVLAISVFFFICFLVFVLLKKAFLIEYDIKYQGFLSAAFGALVLGKVVVILDHLSVTKKLDHLANIYRVLFRSLIYLLGYIAFTFLEHGIMGLIHGEGLLEALGSNLHHTISMEGLATMVVLFLTFFIFNAFWVIRSHLGPQNLYALYFSKEQEHQPLD